MRTNEFSREA